MIDARLENFEEYKPVTAPRPDQLIAVEITTKDAAQDRELLRRRIGHVESVEGGTGLIIPEEGPWVVACLGERNNVNPNQVTTTRLYEIETEGQQLSLI